MTPTNKIAAGVAGVAVLLGSQVYGDWSSRSTADARAKELETQIQTIRAADTARIAELAMELELVQNRIGVTAADTQNAQKLVASTRQEQVRAVAALKQTLAESEKEHTKTVDSLRQESEAVRHEATTQIGAVTGEVSNVKVDLNATKNDLAASRREITDVRDSLGRQIAHNSDEVALLKRRGERDYYEFDIAKKDVRRIAGIRLELNKADMKAHKYDVTLQIDDNRVQKKGQLVNEPVQFLVGKDRVRYELVVNVVDKDRIRGYVSTPKDTVAPNSLALQQD
jgi:DNA repair exonuclease SbcCD ATPase subunit